MLCVKEDELLWSIENTKGDPVENISGFQSVLSAHVDNSRIVEVNITLNYNIKKVAEFYKDEINTVLNLPKRAFKRRAAPPLWCKMFRSCSSFLQRFSSRLKVQPDNDDHLGQKESVKKLISVGSFCFTFYIMVVMTHNWAYKCQVSYWHLR